MAFETIRGESGVDFIGTDGVDSLFALNETGAISVTGLGGNDIIDITDTDGVVGTATIRGGDGNDSISFGTSTAQADSRISASSVNGGAGNDDITLVGAVSSVARGNEGNDNFTLSGNYTGSTINGNTGVDSVTVGAVGIALSNAKILGGNDNDGSLTFDGGAGITSAVDSTINGSAGNDVITIGAVSNATNFTVFGGQGNDVINSSNAGDDDVVYSGDLGDDSITTGAAKDSILGGDGNDTIVSRGDDDTIDGGAGNDTVTSGGDDDTVLLGDGDDTYTDGAGDDTITGGAGADTYNTGGGENVYVFSSVADSAPTTTGTTNGFDTIGAGFASATDTLDLSAVADGLIGDTVTNATTMSVDATLTSTAANFAALASELGSTGAPRLTASSAATNNVHVDIVTVTAGDIAGTYMIVNNANRILDSGDLMFEIAAADAAQFSAYNSDTATSSAFILL